jgi:hypothetical protein
MREEEEDCEAEEAVKLAGATCGTPRRVANLGRGLLPGDAVQEASMW